MAYDGKLMRRALARFDEDKQRRAEALREAQSGRTAKKDGEKKEPSRKAGMSGYI